MTTNEWIGTGVEWAGVAIAVFAVIYGMFFVELTQYEGVTLFDLIFRR